jgi:hypothetical protein
MTACCLSATLHPPSGVHHARAHQPVPRYLSDEAGRIQGRLRGLDISMAATATFTPLRRQRSRPAPRQYGGARCPGAFDEALRGEVSVFPAARARRLSRSIQLSPGRWRPVWPGPHHVRTTSTRLVPSTNRPSARPWPAPWYREPRHCLLPPARRDTWCL